MAKYIITGEQINKIFECLDEASTSKDPIQVLIKIEKVLDEVTEAGGFE